MLVYLQEQTVINAKFVYNFIFLILGQSLH